MAAQNTIRQVSLAQPGIQQAEDCSEADYNTQLRNFRRNLLLLCPDWPGHDKAASPLPLQAPQALAQQFQVLGTLLEKAVTSIVERWWTDDIANFPARMPMPSQQEVLLRVSLPSGCYTNSRC